MLAAMNSASRATAAGESTLQAAEFFEKNVRPVLVERCFSCHGGSAKGKPKGGLRLTSRDEVLRGGDSGPAAIEGKPEDSLLVHAVRYHDEPRMPPNKRLSEAEIDALSRWVESGLPWPSTAGSDSSKTTDPGRPGGFTITAQQRAFWSFQPVVDLAPPTVTDRTWPLSAIDQFVLAKLEAKGFKPAPLADKHTLIRRVSFDLTGLPPTPDEVDRFLADPASNAFERVVDRLLASPQYGERWARHWLDLAHYADTAGETADFPIPEAYRYRNYVIDTFNRDVPYNEFLRDQVAGDILAPEGPRERYAERIIATGFIATSRRFGFDPQNYHHLTIEDTIDTLGKAVLGLTVACARCHDHKFDPISSADYYALYGIFASSRYPFPGSEEFKRPRDFMPMRPQNEVDAIIGPFRARLAEMEARLRENTAAKSSVEKELQGLNREDAKGREALTTKRDRLATARTQLQKDRDAWAAHPPAIELAYAMAEGTTPANVRLQRRGDPKNLGSDVPRRFLEILGGGGPIPAGSGRRQLADWLTDPANPLTARVMVNRIWQHHFGRGIVATPSNFGKQGQRPSHPELLDWLAARFVEGGWSIKKMHRLIVLSRVYQLSSTADSATAERDPDNVWLSHANRRRLDAESIRDAVLATSNGLDRTPGGPHPFPPVASWGFTQHGPFQAVYPSDRRSIYLMIQRTRRHPYLALFDGPDPNASTDRRNVTTVPTQALFFLNNPFIHEQSLKFAGRLLRSGGDDCSRIDLAHRLALGRAATVAEIQETEAFLNDVRAQIQPASECELAAWAGLGRVLFSSNEFLYVD